MRKDSNYYYLNENDAIQEGDEWFNYYTKEFKKFEESAISIKGNKKWFNRTVMPEIWRRKVKKRDKFDSNMPPQWE